MQYTIVQITKSLPGIRRVTVKFIRQSVRQ